MRILNLGCGGRVSAHEDVVNIDWSIALRLKRSFLGNRIAPLFLTGERLAEFQRLGDNILVHDLSKGIPFPDGSVDVVYHSHVLEHLDRGLVDGFLKETLRVLKKGGIQRIVVPDLWLLVKQYMESFTRCNSDQNVIALHDNFISKMIEQSVRRESFGTSQQKPFRRWLEDVVFGDARSRGETHQWMYDKYNLSHLLAKAGYQQIVEVDSKSSAIQNWLTYRLDMNPDGTEYKLHSLYIEAIK